MKGKGSSIFTKKCDTVPLVIDSLYTTLTVF